MIKNNRFSKKIDLLNDKRVIEPFDEVGKWNSMSINDKHIFAHSGDYFPLDVSLFARTLKENVSKDGELILDKLPLLIASIYPADACVHRCRWCYTDNQVEQKAKNMLSKKSLDNIINSAQSVGLKLVRLVGGGEPLLNPLTPYFVESLYEKGVASSLITNGELLGKTTKKYGNVNDTLARSLVQLRVSLDAASNKTHQHEHRPHRQDSFDNIISNIENIANLKIKYNRENEFLIATTFLINQYNYEEIIDFADLCSSIGVNVIWFKSLAEYDCFTDEQIEKINNQLDVVNGSYKNLVVNSSRFDVKTIKNKRANVMRSATPYCFVPKLKAIITADGGVANCISHQYESNFIYGNINSSSLQEIWHNEKHIDLIKKRETVPHMKCTTWCLEETYNKSIALLYDNLDQKLLYKEKISFTKLDEVYE